MIYRTFGIKNIVPDRTSATPFKANHLTPPPPNKCSPPLWCNFFQHNKYDNDHIEYIKINLTEYLSFYCEFPAFLRTPRRIFAVFVFFLFFLFFLRQSLGRRHEGRRKSAVRRIGDLRQHGGIGDLRQDAGNRGQG